MFNWNKKVVRNKNINWGSVRNDFKSPTNFDFVENPTLKPARYFQFPYFSQPRSPLLCSPYLPFAPIILVKSLNFGQSLNWNKKGFEYFEDIMTFLFVSIVLGVGISAVLWMFFSVGADVRMEESKILAVKLVDAVVVDGYLNEEIFDSEFGVEDLMERALIDSNVVHNGGDFYFNLSVRGSWNVKEFVGGKRSFEIACALGGSGDVPECYEKELVVYSRSGSKYVINVLSASRHEGGKL